MAPLKETRAVENGKGSFGQSGTMTGVLLETKVTTSESIPGIRAEEILGVWRLWMWAEEERARARDAARVCAEFARLHQDGYKTWLLCTRRSTRRETCLP